MRTAFKLLPVVAGIFAAAFAAPSHAVGGPSGVQGPDELIRVFADGGQLMLFGDKTTESWGNSGAADFPFAIIGGAASEWGLAARWSLAKFDNRRQNGCSRFASFLLLAIARLLMPT